MKKSQMVFKISILILISGSVVSCASLREKNIKNHQQKKVKRMENIKEHCLNIIKESGYEKAELQKELMFKCILGTYNRINIRPQIILLP